MDYTVLGILQARKLEWVAIAFSRGSSQPRIKSRSPSLQAILYQLSHQGNPRICLQCRRHWFDPQVGNIRWRRDKLPTPVFLRNQNMIQLFACLLMQESPEATGSRIRWATTKQDLGSIKVGVGLISGEQATPCIVLVLFSVLL